MTTPDQPRRRTNAIVLGVVGAILAVIVLIVVVGAIAGDDDDVPAYTVTHDGDQTFTAVVDFDDRASLEAVFDDVRAQNDDLPDGGYDVMINCSTGDTTETPVRLAWGRFAVGNLGAAQLGIDAGDSTIKFDDGVVCPAG